MNEHDLLVERFEHERPRLRAVAYRMLGSAGEADDAVQEAWIRLSRADVETVQNLSAWLTTIVARVSLAILRSRRQRREDQWEAADTGLTPGAYATADPEREALLADSVGLALLVVLDTLTPVERLAFVLHDMFAVPYEDIAPIVDRTPAAARQLASRARRRVQQAGAGTGAGAGGVQTGAPRAAGAEAGESAQAAKAGLVRAFLAASREGDFEALLSVLDPDIVVRTDETAVRAAAGTSMAIAAEIRGADAVTRAFLNRVWAPVPASIDGSPGLVWALNGEPRTTFAFTVEGGRITAVDIRAVLTGLEIVIS